MRDLVPLSTEMDWFWYSSSVGLVVTQSGVGLAFHHAQQILPAIN